MNMAAINKLIKLAQYLDKEAGQILDKSLFASLEIMPQCINNYETNISKALDELQTVDRKDFARIDELFFDVKIELSLYGLDIQKLSYSWLRLLKNKYFIENPINRQMKTVGSHTCDTENHIDILFKRICNTINTFDIVDPEHVFNKRYLKTLKEDVKELSKNSDEMCQALNNLDNLINERFISKNCCEDIEELIDAMLMISYDIHNATYAIDFLLNILTNIVDFYSRKAY